MDCRLVTAWLDPPQFHSRQASTRAARSDALSQKSGLSAHPANQSVTQSLGDGQYQIDQRGLGCVGQKWTKHDQSDQRGERAMRRRSRSERGEPCAANYRSCMQPWKGGSNLITAYCCSRSSPSCASWSPRCEPVLQEIEAQMEPYQVVVELLMTHPGVQAVAAMGFVSEVGIDLSRFKSAKHFASWIGVCPGNYTSAGKRQHGKTTKGNPYLRALLAEIVWGISHSN